MLNCGRGEVIHRLHRRRRVALSESDESKGLSDHTQMTGTVTLRESDDSKGLSLLATRHPLSAIRTGFGIWGLEFGISRS
jgi:hypothetical protein